MTTPLDLPRIIKELKLDVPIYRVQVQEDQVELHLYGGKVVTWKPDKVGRQPLADDREIKVQEDPKPNCDKRNTKQGRKKQ
ncbi:MAG: hypothetical protein ABFD53_09570 [Anaerolineaceae bacterium]